MLGWLLSWSSLCLSLMAWTILTTTITRPGRRYLIDRTHLWDMGLRVVKSAGSPDLQAAWHAHLQLTLQLLFWPC